MCTPLKYVADYRYSTKALQPGVFPSCYGCLGHSLLLNSGQEAAMIEGWADFFEAVTTRYFPDVSVPSPTNIEDPRKYRPANTLHEGPGVEIWVAAFLWDWYDTPADYPSGTDDDNIAVPLNRIQRYENIASRFVNVNAESYLSSMWRLRIKPSLTPGEVVLMCGIVKKNTLGSIDPEACK